MFKIILFVLLLCYLLKNVIFITIIHDKKSFNIFIFDNLYYTNLITISGRYKNHEKIQD